MTRSILASALLLTTIASAAPVPRPSPGFVIHLTPSGQITPEQFKGKVVILTFIFTTCPHCQKLTQYLTGLQKEYAVRGVQVLSAAFNDMPQMYVPDFIKQYRPTFPVGYTTRMEVLTFLGHSTMEQLYVPVTVFIDRKGVIRGEYLGDNPFYQNYEVNIRKQVEELLKEAAPLTKTKPAPTKKKVS